MSFVDKLFDVPAAVPSAGSDNSPADGVPVSSIGYRPSRETDADIDADTLPWVGLP